MEVANGHFSEVLPQVPLNVMRIETTDLGGNWRVFHYSPEGSTGGGPLVIDVDKRTGRIVRGLR
jgi:hypothetical protein